MWDVVDSLFVSVPDFDFSVYYFDDDAGVVVFELGHMLVVGVVADFFIWDAVFWSGRVDVCGRFPE